MFGNNYKSRAEPTHNKKITIMEEDGVRARSFRYEDYNTRRAFLRSYPLHWGQDSEAEESKEVGGSNTTGKSYYKKEPSKGTARRTNGKKPIAKIVFAVIQWSEERAVVFKRFKHKITVYVVSCVPMSLKAPTALISVK